MDPIAPVSATGGTVAMRDLPISPGGLTVGQVVQARVARVDGDTVLLRWGEQLLSVATKVALTVGQQVNLLVEEGGAGKTLLRLMDETSGKGRPARADGAGSGRGTTGSTTNAGGRGAATPMGVTGQAERDLGMGSGGGQGFADPLAEWGVESPARPGVGEGAPGQPGTNGQNSTTSQSGLPGRAATFNRDGLPTTPGAPGAGGNASVYGGRFPVSLAGTPGAPVRSDVSMLLSEPGVSESLAQPGAALAPGAPGTTVWSRSATALPASFASNGASQPTDARLAGGPGSERLSSWPAVSQQVSGSVGRQGLAALTRQLAADPMASLLFEPLDGPLQHTVRAPGVPLDASTDPASAAPDGAGQSTATSSAATADANRSAVANGASTSAAVLLARSALPAYGRLAQSVGGDDAFGLLLNTLGREAGQTLARAPLSPVDVGRLLVDIGLHPDEMNAVLVSEMLTQGTPLNEATVRTLRRQMTTAGGSPTDAASTVLLNRMGLPVTPLSLGIARQLLAGQLDPRAAWGEALGELQQLARNGGSADPTGGTASEIARDLLGGWRVPVEDGAAGVGRWLHTLVDQTARPLEAKLARPLALPDDGGSSDPALAQDVRSRLDTLTQTLGASARLSDQHESTQVLQRLQATIQAEQILNGAAREPDGQRFFVFTLPALAGQQPGSLELRVRERDAREPESAEPIRPDIVRLKLSLPNLGDLGINLTVGQSSIACNFSASSAFAEALIGASSSELVGRLKRLGYQQTTVDAAQQTSSEPTSTPVPALAPMGRVRRVDMRA
jgi:hypothetical protein